MKEMKKQGWRAFGAVLIGALLLAASVISQAGTVTITVNQVGSDIVMTGSGQIDLSSLTFLTSYQSSTPRAVFDIEGFGSFPATDAYYDIYAISGASAGVSYNQRWQTTFSGTATGDNFLVGFLGDLYVYVPWDYTSNAALAFTWTFANLTVGDQGFDFGTVATFGGNSVALVDGAAAAVPIPAAAPLFLTALGALGWLRRRRVRIA